METVKIYIAISKETGQVMSGAKGQYAYGSVASLSKSIGQDWWSRKKAKEQGVRPRDLYNVWEVDALDAINAGRRVD